MSLLQDPFYVVKEYVNLIVNITNHAHNTNPPYTQLHIQSFFYYIYIYINYYVIVITCTLCIL